MTANPLVAAPVDTSTAFGGAGLLESLTDLSSSLESGDWLAAGLSGVGVAMDTAATVMDPLGSLIGAGLGWLMEHLEPLKGWLNDLTGDAGAVLGHAATWDNIAASMASAGDELNRVVTADLEAMSGASVAAYAAYANGLADRVRAAGGSASAMGSALRTCSTVVQVVHDLVRDTLASLVGAIISWAAELVVTVGLATPYVVGQVTTRVGQLAARVGTSVTDVLTSARSLKNLLSALKDALAELAGSVRGRLPGSARGAGDGVPTHPSGMTVGDGARRSTYDQLLDPHIHPDNVRIVEPDYDPFGGLTREEFAEQYHSHTSHGEPSWNWPPHDGAVPGTVSVRPLTGTDHLPLDRIGGGGGTYFSPADTPFGARSLPPDRLNFERTGWTVDTNHPLVQSGRVQLETSRIAGWFGQDGGGVQHQFVTTAVQPDGSVVTQALKQDMLERLGIIRKAT
ncbi:TNT domain-containing protein [Cellulomonas hominis]|uniref:TNT domain-containing protein n=1 Tax=Cellulomonas hominis TaxID=156981 RepID=UPI001B97CF05|nr:TNT domain-containing protein [Cellulomonas hominis]VTR75703.1 hypothetical protein CHMI_00455 [Cellulomonas hominis]